MTTLAALTVGAGCGGDGAAAAPDAPEATEHTASALDTALRDGRYSDANGWASPQYGSTVRFPDLDADGVSDFCGRGIAGIWCAVDDGSGNLINDAVWSPFFSDANGFAAAPYYSTIAYPDLDGDGYADVCGRGPTGISCAISTGHAFGSVTLWDSFFSDAGGWNAVQDYSTIRFPDVNGDGKADVCGRGKAGLYCALSTGTKFGPTTVWNTVLSDAGGGTLAKYYATIAFPDLNGDHKADLCVRASAGLWCSLSTGAAFGTVKVWNPTFSDVNGWGNSPVYYGTIQYADLNKDGKADVCGRSAAGMSCALSTGATFGTTALWSSTFSDASGWANPQYASTIRVVRDVLCGRGSAGIWCAFSNGSGFDGMGVQSTTESDANGWNQPAYYGTVSLTSDLEIADRGAAGIYGRRVQRPGWSDCNAHLYVDASTSIPPLAQLGTSDRPYATLARAFDAANEGHACSLGVDLRAGTYSGDYVIRVPTKIAGSGQATTTLDGSFTNYTASPLSISSMTISQSSWPGSVFVANLHASTSLYDVKIASYNGFGVRQHGGTLTLSYVNIGDAFEPVPLMSRSIGDIQDLMACDVWTGMDTERADSDTSIGQLDTFSGWGGAGVFAYAASLDFQHGTVVRTTGPGVAGVGASLQGSSLTIDHARGAGFIGSQGTAAGCGNCIAEGTTTGDLPAGPNGALVTGVADGFMSLDGSMNISWSVGTQNGRVGIDYINSSGACTNSQGTNNALYGLYVGGTPRPTIDPSCVFSGNGSQNVWSDGNLPLPHL